MIPVSVVVGLASDSSVQDCLHFLHCHVCVALVWIDVKIILVVPARDTEAVEIDFSIESDLTGFAAVSSPPNGCIYNGALELDVGQRGFKSPFSERKIGVNYVSLGFKIAAGY